MKSADGGAGPVEKKLRRRNNAIGRRCFVAGSSNRRRKQRRRKQLRLRRRSTQIAKKMWSIGEGTGENPDDGSFFEKC
ncbi:hypothetical protein LXL04_002930 [Taraxacum kok-saghyz]